MSKYYIYHDVKRCIGCFSCESHCKAKNNLPVGPRFCQIIPVGPKLVNNLPRTANIFIPCFHCENPWCVNVCPTGVPPSGNHKQEKSSNAITVWIVSMRG